MAELEKHQSLHIECLELLLWPVVRFSLRNSHSFRDFVNVARIVFVRAAEREIHKTGEKVNVSRLSAVTGIYRKDITRIYREKVSPPEHPLSLLARVMGQWEQDPRFLNKARKPRTITCAGEDSEFHHLVSSVTKHLHPGTVLFELERSGAVKKSGNRLKLLKQMPPLGANLRRGFQLLSDEVDTLIRAVEENIKKRKKTSNLHIRTEYDNVFQKDLPGIRRWLIDEGKAFHRRARDFLSKFDQDIRPNPEEEAGAKVVVSAFSLISHSEEEL